MKIKYLIFPLLVLTAGIKPELFLPGLISSPAHDYVVRFTPGGDGLYLMRSDMEFNTAILLYQCRSGYWWEVGPAPIPFAGNIAYPCFSVDGQQLFFDGNEAGQVPDIFTARRQGDGWSQPQRLGPEVNGPAVEMHCSVAANGNLYFSSNRDGGRGSFDIYCAKKKPQGYAQAENLGLAVNSAEFDAHPFIAPDESYLLFDARRSSGFGSNDIFISFKNAAGSWTPARNLGPEINTAAGEMRPYAAPGGRGLFFCSDRNGSQDIWRVDAAVIDRLRAKTPKDMK